MKKVFFSCFVVAISCPPVLSENVIFQDPVVKSLCINNWDDDGDGELSLDEASAVKNLGGVFRCNQNITSFDELQFFTGLSSIEAYAFYESTIKSVVIPSNVISIGNNAFQYSSIGPSLLIPGNVKEISMLAFANCKYLRRIVLGEGVESIGYNAFTGYILSLSIPTTIKNLALEFINPYIFNSSSTNIDSQMQEGDFYLYTHNLNPIEVQRYAFRRLFGDGHLVVPFGSKQAYKSASDWKNFRVILEYGDVNEDGYVNIVDVVAVVNHILGKENARFNELIADVNGDGTINIADVIGIIDFILGD